MRYDKQLEQVILSCEELCGYTAHYAVAAFAERRKKDCEQIGAVIQSVTGVGEEARLLASRVEAGGVSFMLTASVDFLVWEGEVPALCFVQAVSSREFNKKPHDAYTTYMQCCAYLFGKENDLPRVGTRLYVKNTEGEELRTVERTFSQESSFELVRRQLEIVARKAKLLVAHETEIRPSAAEVVFPYEEVREGQDELIRRGYTAIKQGKRLFAQAPTGIGKTISTLYPAVRAFGKGLCDKIFYFTAKSSTAREAYNATARLFEAGARLRAVMITAKEQMCPTGGCGKHCNPRECAFLRSYEERAEKAIGELIASRSGYYPELILEAAARHGVCPYELSLDLSELCDIIICDYNYLFDPMVYLRRYFDEPGRFGEYVFLIDEAHNLVDRAREMYSVTLRKSDVLDFLEQLPEEEKTLREAVSALVPVFEGLGDLCRDSLHTDGEGMEIGYYVSRNRVNFFCAAVTKLWETLSKWLRANREHPLYETVDGYFALLRKFISILQYYDDKFMTYVEKEGEEISASLACMDPSDVLDGRMRLGRASILFSATLTPTSYFSDVLGGGKEAVCVELPSPYEPENLCLAAVDTISTRFEDRDGNCRKVATLIAAAVSPKAGNYIVYFPSYGYLKKVHEAFVKKYPKVKTIVQSRGMNRSEREAFINSFREDEGKMRIGFCVLGGVFSEGVDLPGSRLIGSIIVGVGLPGFSSERNLMRDYFENRYENGFDYAYTFPGMNSVLQAAGRVIRRDEDEGIVVLIDDRYGTPTYQKLFPSHWKHLKYAGNSASLAEIARKFWEKRRK